MGIWILGVIFFCSSASFFLLSDGLAIACMFFSIVWIILNKKYYSYQMHTISNVLLYIEVVLAFGLFVSIKSMIIMAIAIPVAVGLIATILDGGDEDSLVW